ncbi:MAG: FAD-dependent oxidoreductase [Planctomycetota bacterium]|jgi:hypothetical protein|nr:FAD-dependent oxidoreductase [Planctomycetota bacterium]
MNNLLNKETIEVDVCVVGGGMAGICAAIASSRNGARTLIIQDRPVLGGNASSEIRMWICGAHGPNNKETGVLEEIQLENLYRNPTLNYAMWDHVLYGKVSCQPNLQTMLNTSCVDAQVRDGRIESIRAWQLTSQTWFTVHARIFIDCSGDSILAATTGAAFRAGRESRHEFDEDIQPESADKKTMGNSILLQMRKTDEPQPFTPPPWAYEFDAPVFEHRMRGIIGTNFWWIELGGLQDTIRDAEEIRHELLRTAYGVWDYIKNRADEKDRAENWALEWIGSLPGKRENRRYEGAHILTQNDVRDGGQFEDTVAFGGWTMDDHHPAGLMFPGKPTIFHPAPSPYGIPYRSLYSRNIDNLMFAGRNISVTHAALSSTRVMATCSIIGQAAGTAAGICIQRKLPPSGLYPDYIADLQQTLMEDDAWLPGLHRQPDPLTCEARVAGDGDGIERIADGTDRDRPDESHAWEAAPGDEICWEWEQPVQAGGVRLVFDSDLSNNKRMPCAYPVSSRPKIPKLLVKSFRIESRSATGQWGAVYREDENCQRVLEIPLEVETTALRFIPESTWGESDVRVFGFEPLRSVTGRRPAPPQRVSFSSKIKQADPADLAPPPENDSAASGKGTSA